MRIFSTEGLQREAARIEDTPWGIFSRRRSPSDPLSPYERRVAEGARQVLADVEWLCERSQCVCGDKPFDLATIWNDRLQQAAILDEASTYHRLFPEEWIAWIPQGP